MTFNGPANVARILASGNNDLVFDSPLGVQLPSEEALTGKLDSYLSDRGGVKGLPPLLQHDLSRVFDRLYRQGDTIKQKQVIVGTTESIIIADGSRPVFFLQGDHLTPKGTPDGPFVDALNLRKDMLEHVARSVGRIESEDFPAPEHAEVFYTGTAFLVAPDIVMTNRHVLEAMVEQPTSAGPFTLNAEYWVNFDGQLGGGSNQRFKILDIAFAGTDFIGKGGNFEYLDMALLQIGTPFAAGSQRPTPLALTARRLVKETKVAAIGFPGRPQIYNGVGTPPAGYELESVLREHFDERFGYKRCGAGRVSTPVPGSVRDTKKWVMAHDAATLGGNSGSPMIALDRDRGEVSALHFFGTPRKANFAHVFDTISDKLSEHDIEILTD